MATRRVEAAPLPRDAWDGDEILRLALSRPSAAVEEAAAALRRKPAAREASFALQALGIAHRELGDGRRALRFARRALLAAQQTADSGRVADVRATLGATLALQGRTREALAELDAALPDATGLDAARIRMRRGAVLRLVGREDEALEDLRIALTGLRAGHDVVYEARALTQRALIYDARGQHGPSDRDLERAERLLGAAGQHLESILARGNRGYRAYRNGDLPDALRHLDAADEMFRELGQRDPNVVLDRCRCLLAAGLPDDARHAADSAAEILAQNSAGQIQRAEALTMAASASLAAGAFHDAAASAHDAVTISRRHHQDHWRVRAQRTLLTALWLSGDWTPSTLPAAIEVTEELERRRDPEAVDGHLLAGRIAARLGKRALADQHFGAAAEARRSGPAMGRATGWLAKALQADATGDSAAMLSACRRGLDLLDEHRLTLGATEMRARATVHGAELASLATRHAARTMQAGHLLAWSERWRATTLTAAPVRPPDDDELALELAELRDVTREIGELRAEGAPTRTLEREQSRLEASVRRRMLRTSGVAQGRNERFDLHRLRGELGNATLVELVEVDDVLHLVTVTSRRIALHTVGPTEKALSELEFALFGLRRIAAATSPALVRASARSLQAAAGALEQALLGPAAQRLGDGPVLVVPSGRLHAVPWSLLPSLCDREVSVAPSATSWLRARAMTPPRQHRVALVVGPGLVTGGAEVEKVAHFYPRATVLPETAATADDVLSALDGVSLAHIAAHGTFRADNALFSSLRLTDGPLTVHDLERLRRPPHRLVLSSCDSGLGEVAGADELLGLSSALIGLGCAGLLASVVQVNDPATVPLMVAVHEQLRQGATLAQALHRARMSLGTDDPVLAATGQSFVALGAA